MIITTLKRALLPLTLFAILATAPEANAYYDPCIQRWISRDPHADIGFLCKTRPRFVETIHRLRLQSQDIGSYNSGYVTILVGDGANLFAIVGNNPINMYDAYGLLKIGYGCKTVADPEMGTGGYVCQLNVPFSFRTCKFAKLATCLAGAIAAMEEGCTIGSRDIFGLGCQLASVCFKAYGR